MKKVLLTFLVTLALTSLVGPNTSATEISCTSSGGSSISQLLNSLTACLNSILSFLQGGNVSTLLASPTSGALADLKTEMEKLRSALAMLLITPGLSKPVRVQVKAAYRTARSLPKSIAKAEKALAKGQSIDSLMRSIQSQLDTLVQLLQSLLPLLGPTQFATGAVQSKVWPISPGIVVYDLRGSKVKVLQNHLIPILSTAELTDGLAKGVYLYRHIGKQHLYKLVVGR